MTIPERLESLKRGVQYGLDNDKKNMIVDLDLLAVILHLSPVLYCEHGIQDGEFCRGCNAAHKAAMKENGD